MSDFIEATIKASKQIIKNLSQRKSSYMQIHQIGAGGDRSIGADLLCEEIFIKHLSHIANIDSEESGNVEGKGKDIIILDPLDGSDNYLSNIPYYGASLALCDQYKNIKEAAIINFCTKNIYFDSGDGIKEIGLYEHFTSNNNRYSLTKCGIFEKAYSNPIIAAKFYEKKIKFRSLGATALSLANAHNVNFVLFGGKIREYDCKAGLFLCKDLWIENFEHFLLVSRNKQIFDMILKIIK